MHHLGALISSLLPNITNFSIFRGFSDRKVNREPSQGLLTLVDQPKKLQRHLGDQIFLYFGRYPPTFPMNTSPFSCFPLEQDDLVIRAQKICSKVMSSLK